MIRLTSSPNSASGSAQRFLTRGENEGGRQ